MDEKKILILCTGDGLPAGGFMDRFVKQLVSEGVATVEICNVDNIKMGTEAKLLAWEEMTNVDFSELEHRAQAMMLGEKIHETVEGLATGRLSKDSPKFQDFPGVAALHSDAWKQLLELNSADRQSMKDRSFFERYAIRGNPFQTVHPQLDQIRKPGKSRLFAAPYGTEAIKPADHPTRKREPKGPRGKWGKL